VVHVPSLPTMISCAAGTSEVWTLRRGFDQKVESISDAVQESGQLRKISGNGTLRRATESRRIIGR
jgi:hypothetical protein